MKFFPLDGDSGAVFRAGIPLLLIYIFFILNLRFEMIRFSYEPLNNFFFLLVLTIPTVLIGLALRFRQTWLKTTCVAVLTLPAVGSLVLAVLTLAVLPGAIRENSPVFESRIRMIPMDHYRLDVLYGDHVVTIRQERPILPGILLVRRMYTAPGTDVRLEVLDSDRARVTSIIDPESTGGRILSPKRFVYF